MTDSGEGSLRAAIAIANSNDQNDEIRLNAGTYSLSEAGTDDSNLKGDLDVTEQGRRLVIRGVGTNQTIVSGSELNDRVLHVAEGAILELVDLTIVGGSDVALGGGIFNEGQLILTRAFVTKNSASVGGGIANWGTIDVTDSSVISNHARIAGDDLFDRDLRDSRTIHEIAFVPEPVVPEPVKHERATRDLYESDAVFALVHGDSSRISETIAYHGETSFLTSDTWRSALTFTGEHQAGSLTAGSIDDLSGLDDFLAYYGEHRQSQEWGLDTVIQISVTNGENLSLEGASIKIESLDGTEVFAELESGTDGRALFIPSIDGASTEGKYRVTVTLGDQVDSKELDSSTGRWDFELQDATSVQVERLDMAFVVDTTGSMSDELRFLLTELRSIVLRTKELHPAIDIRLGLVVYRDEGDQYVSRTFDFTSSVDDFLETLADQEADGGGDYPEAMHKAIDDAHDLSWRTDDTARVMFLIADAPPHSQHRQSTLDAANQLRLDRVKVFPVAASGVAEEAEFVMRTTAMITQGEYLFLTDDSGFGGTHQEPEVESYDVERLDQLMQRMISSEILGREIPPSLILRHQGGPLNPEQIVLVDDEFRVSKDVAEHDLDILQNDYLVNHDASIDSIVIHPETGQLSISDDGKSLLYRPDQNAEAGRVFATYSVVIGETTYQAAITIDVEAEWQNSSDPLDVDGDGAITESDAEDVVFALSTIGVGELGFERGTDNAYLDTTGDGALSLRDLIRVVNRMTDVEIESGKESDSH